jgi:magnesium transporter
MMIRALYFSKEETLRTGLDMMEIAFLLQNLEGLLWVDFHGNPPEIDKEILSETFKFHPLAVDDALEEAHVPKIDDWGKYLYVVLHAVVAGENHEVSTRELDVFLGENYLVTHHDEEIEAITHVWDSVQRDPRHLRNGPDHLLYRLVDELVGSYLPVVEVLDQWIDQIEDQLFNYPKPEIVEQIFAIKRAVLHLRRIIAPQREVLNKMARDNYPTIDQQAQVYFRDIYDHLVRLYSIAENIRDLVSDTMDTYLSVINNRLNEVMKTLTIITTFFMPITFITGFFGMNFFFPHELFGFWTRGPVFIATLVLLFLIPISLFLWIRRRGWM